MQLGLVERNELFRQVLPWSYSEDIAKELACVIITRVCLVFGVVVIVVAASGEEIESLPNSLSSHPVFLR
ncbi:hypothetical protein BDN67DRAFT_966020 [Paxillus ammoniavirescens]|nr:hypothetical protein BDN67DRAFT_966020 [Paxillus ammoniavirescens]